VNRKQLFLVILTFIPLFFISTQEANGKKIKCIVIDAGHGGHDPGAVGYSKTKEKDVALSIALKLGKLIQTNYPDIKVIYTRKTDVFVELHRRASIANENKADLFISIHCNSSKKSDPFGVETWVMGLHKSAANLEVAKKENASILMEKDHVAKYDGFNPNSAEAYIIFSLFQNMYISQSLALANAIQLNFKNALRLSDRGVKQAGFLVLYKTSMPSVLVEVGFVSNPRDEVYLKKDNGQESIAFSLFQAFVNYKSSIEGVKETVKPTINLLTYDQVKTPADTTKKPHHTPTDSTRVNILPLTEKYVDNTKPNKVKVITPPIKEKQAIDSTALYIKPKNKSEANTAQNIVFRVQFWSSPTHKTANCKEFQNLENIFEYMQGETFKYSAGMFTTIEEAVVYQTKMQGQGFADCFVIAFNNGVRISPTEATRILNSQKH
jgi:N-acetylmuramoyl-L-alanine amidase